MGIVEKYSGNLFGNTNINTKSKEDIRKRQAESEKLIELQARLLMEKYNSICLDAKQLKEALNVGQSNVYSLLESDKLEVRKIGNRKVVPIASLAKYLILGDGIDC